MRAQNWRGSVQNARESLQNFSSMCEVAQFVYGQKFARTRQAIVEADKGQPFGEEVVVLNAAQFQLVLMF